MIAVQSRAHNATRFNEFIPVVEGCTKRFAEVLLWLCHILGLCCAVVGQFAIYICGRLTSPPYLLTIYVAYPTQKLSPEIRVLQQIQNTPVFYFGFFNFLFLIPLL